jgi:hypothetical protein
MASDSKQEKVQHEEGQEHAANADATHREACEYWGYLLKPDKCGTDLLDRLLKGIAQIIVSLNAQQAREVSRTPVLITLL